MSNKWYNRPYTYFCIDLFGNIWIDLVIPIICSGLCDLSTCCIVSYFIDTTAVIYDFNDTNNVTWQYV